MADDKTDDKQQGNTFDANNPEVKALIDNAIKDATAGLTKNRDDLLAEKKQLAERAKLLDDLGGEAGIKQLREFQERMSKDEEGKLIAEGKLDEVLNRRTKALIERNEKQVANLTQELENARKQASDYQTKFQRGQLDNAVARKITGLQEGSLDLVQQLSRDLLYVNDEGKIEPREDAPVWKDGKPVGLETLRDYLLEVRPFLFKASAGGAATPTAGVNGGGKKLPRSQFDQLAHKERAKFIRSGGTVVDGA